MSIRSFFLFCTFSVKRSAVYFTFLTSILIPQHALIDFVEPYCGILFESFGYFGSLWSLRTGFHKKAENLSNLANLEFIKKLNET